VAAAATVAASPVAMTVVAASGLSVSIGINYHQHQRMVTWLS
jgi:hypothetical protein